MPEGAARVYATIDGTLASALPAGQRVMRGEVIGRLKNVEVSRELARVEGEFRLRKLRVEHLERLRGVDPAANDELPTARAALADAERRADDRRQEEARLALASPSEGIILPAPRSTSANTSPERLARWSGSLLDASNLGATVEPGTLVCLVGDPSRHTAILLVDEMDVKRLQPGQNVWMRIEELPGRVIQGKVVDVARREVQGADSETAGQSDLAALYAGILPAGRHTALYEARVRFDMPEELLVIGGRGQAKVATERITFGRSILRLLGQTFRLPM
jgi:putative peptide zinc metalloprotease protein